MGERELLRDRAAERPTENAGTPGLGRAERGYRVHRPRAHSDALRAALRLPEPPIVEGDHAVAGGERGYQRLPQAQRSTRAHDEQKRLAGASLTHVESDPRRYAHQ